MTFGKPILAACFAGWAVTVFSFFWMFADKRDLTKKYEQLRSQKAIVITLAPNCYEPVKTSKDAEPVVGVPNAPR